jgi:hypothetical protein
MFLSCQGLGQDICPIILCIYFDDLDVTGLNLILENDAI